MNEIRHKIKINSPKEIGRIVKQLRKEQKITQQELADFANLSRIGVVKLEKGEGDVKLSSLIKIASLLGLDVILQKRGLS